MSDDREWYQVPGEGEFPNLETARAAAEGRAAKSDSSVEIYRYTRRRVACLKREVTVREMDVSQGSSPA